MAGFWNEVPVSRLPILLACTNWVVYTSEGRLKWEAICGWCSVFISFSPSFFMCQLNVISSGKPAQHLPTPTSSRWVTPLLLAAPTSFSQQLLQLQLKFIWVIVYLMPVFSIWPYAPWGRGDHVLFTALSPEPVMESGT